jgi:hypothetical protein
MDDYNFWSDLLATWQSTSDWIKALAILTPQATALAALALLLRHRQARRRAAPLPAGTLAYTIWRDEDDRLHVVRHEAGGWANLTEPTVAGYRLALVQMPLQRMTGELDLPPNGCIEPMARAGFLAKECADAVQVLAKVSLCQPRQLPDCAFPVGQIDCGSRSRWF